MVVERKRGKEVGTTSNAIRVMEFILLISFRCDFLCRRWPLRPRHLQPQFRSTISLNSTATSESPWLARCLPVCPPYYTRPFTYQAAPCPSHRIPHQPCAQPALVASYQWVHWCLPVLPSPHLRVRVVSTRSLIFCCAMSNCVVCRSVGGRMTARHRDAGT